ncbi:MAG: hypothetical protein H6719_28790 [Sandaracinaceae bacterium]|nr:hypothetical protein [Sandaracinaceae bacterium]
MRALLCFALLIPATSVAAQEQTFGESHFVGDVPVDVVAQWSGRGGRPHGHVEVRAGGAGTTIHDGTPAYAWAAGGSRGVLVALVGASSTVEVAYVPLVDGHPGGAVRSSIHRLASSDRSPIGAAVAERPDGFAVFWQEASNSNPSAIYETYTARFDADGHAVGESQRVQAPWPIADVAWVPSRNQYYFLVYYGGADPRGTRLCGVHVDPASLQNLEHPWWASRPGAIDEARLVVRGDAVSAVYRDDRRLFEIDVTGGSWGTDPAMAPRDHGPIASDEAYGLRVEGGSVAIRRSPLAH